MTTNTEKDTKSKKTSASTLEKASKSTHIKSEEKMKSKKKESKKTKDEVTISKSEYENLLKARELSEKYLYLYSEFETYKTRMRKEQDQTRTRWIETVITDFLPVVDNIDIALAHLENHEGKEAFKDFVDGLNMIRTQFLKSLSSYNVKEIEALNKPFDPNFHEAMDQQKDETKDSGVVLREYQKGYMINDKVLRPSRVSVNGK